MPTRHVLPLLFVSRPGQLKGTRREPFNSTPMAVNSISSGPPHVCPMGVHRTCGEPNEIKKNTHPPKNITCSFWRAGARFYVFVHQMREPLASITSAACTEPILQQDYLSYLGRHIPIAKYAPRIRVFNFTPMGVGSISSGRPFDFTPIRVNSIHFGSPHVRPAPCGPLARVVPDRLMKSITTRVPHVGPQNVWCLTA